MNRVYEFPPDTKRIIAVGDLHGDLASFEKAISIWKEQPHSQIVFLGDYADRGHRGVEILEALMELSKNEDVICLKGNHEDFSADGTPYWMPSDLPEEVREKRGDWKTYFKDKLKPFLKSLFLAAIIPGQILFVHGGLCYRMRDLKSLQLADASLTKEILWNDPAEGLTGERKNRARGTGMEFGEDITDGVMKRLAAKLIIRSHQPTLAVAGPHFSHHGKIMTISSTSSYDSGSIRLYKPHFLVIFTNGENYSYQIK